MLFKTTQEVKDFLPANTAFEFKDIEPFIKLQAEPNFLMPVLSQAQYILLHTKYQGTPSDMTDDEKQLLSLSRMVVANFAYLLYIPFGRVSISKGGINIDKSDTKRSAWPEVIHDLKMTCISGGFIGLENLVKFLEEKKDVFTAWRDSSTYSILMECFINTADDFDEYFRIAKSRLTFLSVKPIMKMIEKTYLRNIIGTALFDTIKTQIKTGSVDTDNKYLLTEFIKPAVANLTISYSMKQLKVRLTADGVVVMMGSMTLDSKYIQPAPREDIESIREQSLEDGMESLKNLQEYLNKTASGSKYSDYFSSEFYEAPGSDPTQINNENRGIAGF
jgi:hypothetical protein